MKPVPTENITPAAEDAVHDSRSSLDRADTIPEFFFSKLVLSI